MRFAMRRALPPLLSLRVFESAGYHLNFTKAAEELSVTQGAVSRHIRNLEEALSRRLFERGPRGVVLTPFGASYLARVRQAFDLLEDASRGRGRSKSVIALDVMPSLANLWLLPRLSAFSAKHPWIELRVATSMAPVDFSRDEPDLAIRLGNPPGARAGQSRRRIDFEMVENWRGVCAEHLADDVLTPVGRRELCGEAASARELAGLPLIHNFNRPFCWSDWFRSHGLRGTGQVKDLECGHFFMALEAARQGEGMAILPSLMLTDHALADDLVAPCEGVPSGTAYYLLARESAWEDRAIRTVVRWIKDQVPPALRRDDTTS